MYYSSQTLGCTTVPRLIWKFISLYLTHVCSLSGLNSCHHELYGAICQPVNPLIVILGTKDEDGEKR